ncbi:FAD binding domain-containing protein [Nemania sp. FL0916]|nr:FAD binding domain-containing protein [Nemania sp. FL0916]
MGADSPIDVLIVGAGPVGLALALDLGQRGIRTTIIEQRSGPDTEIQAKASVLDERTMEYCRSLGIADTVVNAGYPEDLPGDTVFSTSLDGKYIGRLSMPSAKDRPVPPESSEMMRRCPQFLFDAVLSRAVAAQRMADIRYSTECIGCIQHSDGVTVLAKSSESREHEELRARYVIGCDGPASIIRKAVGIEFEGKDLGYSTSAIVNVDLSRYCTFGRAERYVFISPEGAWGNFTTIDGKKMWRFTVVGVTEKIDLSTFDIDHWLRRAIGCEDAEYIVVKMTQWRRSQYVADRFVDGRVFLAGDAAHVMSPTGGHGLNTGLGDARDLSWMLQGLLEGWGGESLINAYNIERRPIALRNCASSSRNFQIWKDRIGRDKVLENSPEADEQRRALGEQLAVTAAQEFQALGIALGYNYADSPLIVSDGSLAPPDEARTYIQTSRPGHRAPHVWLEDNKSTIDLFGKTFVLLRYEADPEEEQIISRAARQIGIPLVCVNLQGKSAQALYEYRNVLVRPDGMVAWRGNSLPRDIQGLLDQIRGALTVSTSS